ncbi:outer membrane protein assembly factor BamE [Acidovorax sp. FJL06]|uniref:outer membrane protein assembly factor BamE n=1 Tax=Acidovorax sp. FJL06 TaxID=2153365 RepID=UPI000F56BE0F|nr:outer membrane protein assembly factor BamE [Acidovorax sp. FJL06]RQO81146.1 outer membrane protein assembly factor BamE [Acidovorax sp. FJL06]
MPVKARCSARLGLVLLIGASVAALAGCGSLDGASGRIAGIVKPYKVDVVQGNFVSREQVQALQPGMSRQQVREILGTPLVTSLFHADRWEYVFTLKRPGEDIQTRKLTVFFTGDALERSEGDEMPTETEFVATLGARSGAKGQVPVLDATPEQLAKYPPSARPAQAPVAAPAAPVPSSYPPLDAPAR